MSVPPSSSAPAAGQTIAAEASEEPLPPVSSLAPLRQSTFRAIWLATMGSNFGGLIQMVGAAWLMTQLSGEADMIALVQASTTLPIVFLSLVSGAIADSFNRRNVMLIAQSFMFVISIALTVSAWFGLITPWSLLAFTFLIGCGQALNNPSWQASVGDIVSREDLPAAVTLNSMGFNISRSLGPALGGAIVGAAGAAAAFAVNAVSYLGIIFVLIRWRPALPESRLPRENLGSAMMAGLRYLSMSPNIETVMLRSCAFGISASSVMALMPVIARDLLLGGPEVYGLLLGAFGLGAVATAFSNQKLRARFAGETLVRIAFCSFAACAIISALSPTLFITLPAMLLGGASWVMALSLFNTTVQLSTPRWVVGRLLALYQMATFAGMALGAWVWGLVAEASGADTALLIAGALMLAGASIGFFLPLPAPPKMKLDPLNRWKEPPLALDIKPQSGPLVIMVEYHIAEEHTGEFLELMAERRKLRYKNGARAWTLMRDMEDPDLWQETYHLPTWTDYVRYHQRTTEADLVTAERLWAINRNGERPVIHRMIERSTDWTANSGPVPRRIVDVP